MSLVVQHRLRTTVIGFPLSTDRKKSAGVSISTVRKDAFRRTGPYLAWSSHHTDSTLDGSNAYLNVSG